ncbi:phosphatidylinositol-3,5-bisphosphate 5-phosphatase [Thecaphora frezii]
MSRLSTSPNHSGVGTDNTNDICPPSPSVDAVVGADGDDVSALSHSQPLSTPSVDAVVGADGDDVSALSHSQPLSTPSALPPPESSSNRVGTSDTHGTPQGTPAAQGVHLLNSLHATTPASQSLSGRPSTAAADAEQQSTPTLAGAARRATLASSSGEPSNHNSVPRRLFHEARSASISRATNTIPDPAVSLSSIRPTTLPPPKLSTATSFAINSTPTLTPGSTWGPLAASAAAGRTEASETGRIGDLKRFTLWETKTRFYLVAYNASQTRFRILKVDRTPPIAASGGGSAQHDRDSEAVRDPSAAASSARNDFIMASRILPSATGDRQPQTDAKCGGGAKNLHPANSTCGTFTVESQASSPKDAAANISASGQRYLDEYDPEIPHLNKRILDTRQTEAAPRDVQANNAFSSVPLGSKFMHTNQPSVSSTAGAHFADVPSQMQGQAGSSAHAALNTARPFQVADPLPAKPGHRHSISRSRSARMDADWELNVTSDTVVYTRTQVAELLEMIREGNRSSGGLREVGRFFGIVGFVRFTSTYYMVLISRRSVVALIGGHYIYHCDETVILPVCHPTILAALPGRTKAQDQEEARLLQLFKQVDLGKNFYFSYTYDLTKTLQDNLTSSPEPAALRTPPSLRPSVTAWGYNEKFIWNHHLLLPAFGGCEHTEAGEDPRNGWVLPLVYGFVDQAKLSVLNRTIYVTLIARRSRHFAGARFLKRGINERGHVANDVETEQIVSEALTTPFFAPARRPAPERRWRNDSVEHSSTDGSADVGQGGDGGNPRLASLYGYHNGAEEHSDARYDASPRYTSYVMMRGSIPIYWTQDSTNMSPRPPVEISLVDPYYSAAALHFDDLFHRYGTPVIVLNLIKSKEKQEREVKLLRAFGECIDYLNQFLPASKRIHHIAWDMSRASKSHDQDVIGILEDIAEESVETTRFFHSGPEPSSFGCTVGIGSEESNRRPYQEEGPPSPALRHNSKSGDDSSTDGDRAGPTNVRRDTILLQDGIVRVNCVDCLDRTNAAQFVIGKAAFGHQLHALGLLDDPSLPFDSDAVNMLTEMYHDLGDTIAMQYGGSALAHTTDTYRKINQWTSHSRDVLESMKRFYANSFADADKQAAINLFLGVDPDAPDFAPYVFPEVVEVSTSHDDGEGSQSTGAVIDVNRAGPRADKRNSSLPARTAAAPLSLVPFRPHYRNWYTPEHIATSKSIHDRMQRLKEVANTDAGFWAEYYRPSLFTDLQRHHAYKMTAVHQSTNRAIGAVVVEGGHPGSAPANAYGAMGRHIRSPSSPSVATAPPLTERSVVYPSPFKPHGIPGRHRSSSSATAVEASARRRHLKRDSVDCIGTSGALAAAGGGSVSPSPSLSSVTTTVPSKALIGGVRRWMSINRPIGQKGDGGKRRRGGQSSTTEGMDISRQGQRGDPGSSNDTTAGHGKGPGNLSVGGYDPYSFNFAGPWQAMGIGLTVAAAGLSNQAIPAAHFTLDTVLAKVCNPSVSREEEAEYAFYTDQFRNESLAAGGDSLGFSTWSSGRPEVGDGTGVSNRFIDEKDVQIYEESVALKRGDVTAVEDMLRSEPWTAGSRASGNVDPALVAYAASYETLASAATANLDAKVRAYSSWLYMGQVKLTSF